MPVTYTNPTVGGDNGAWGSKLNTLHDTFATFMNGLETTLGTLLPKNGGVLTGLLTLKTAATAHVVLASAGAQSLDLSAQQSFAATITGPTTFTIANPPAGTVLSGFILRLVNGGSAAITWPTSVKWASGTAPALTAAGTDLLVFTTDDNGTTWRGAVAIKDAR